MKNGEEARVHTQNRQNKRHVAYARALNMRQQAPEGIDQSNPGKQCPCKVNAVHVTAWHSMDDGRFG
ncbi:MAG: hypothetical protein Cons2KO_34010 [Congregibacter sp.]